MLVRFGLCVAALALASCMRANVGTPVTPIEVRSTPGAPSGDVPGASGSCSIHTDPSTLDLKVRAGDESLDFRIVQLPTESEIAKDGSALVHVKSAIEFDGTIPLADSLDSSEVSLHVTRPIEIGGGIVKLAPKTEVLRARRAGDAANGVVILGGAEIEGAPVPCSALGIETRSIDWPLQLTTHDDDDRDLSWVVPRDEVLHVCSSAGGASPCVRTKGLTFEEVRRSGNAVEVRARFDDGGEVHGWAQADQLKASSEPERAGYGASGGCGCGGRRMLSQSSARKPDPREHFGKAILKAGSAIYAHEDFRGAWAKAAKDVEIDIEMHGPDDHAKVTDLPGIMTSIGCNCGGIDDHAWVKRESVVPIR